MISDSQKIQQKDRGLKESSGDEIAGDSRDLITDLVKRGLSEQERLFVLLYYGERLSVVEIGQVLDLSEARVKEMHASILSRLRVQMHWQGRDAAGCDD